LTLRIALDYVDAPLAIQGKTLYNGLNLREQTLSQGTNEGEIGRATVGGIE
jgi:hypothetical protein